MRNTYYNHQHLQSQHEPQAEQQKQQQRSKGFLPMWCSSSKQVKISHRRCASSSSPSSSITEEPSSPKVGCMGQVKRKNRVVEFPSKISFNSATSCTSSNVGTHQPMKRHDQSNSTNISFVKYHKLKRFFSTSSPTSVIPAASGSQKCRHVRNHSGVVDNHRGRAVLGSDHHHLGIKCRSKVNDRSNSCGKKSENGDCVVNLVELDPPLPVVKKPMQQQQQSNDGENNGSSLWKRRSGDVPLKSLQLQLPLHNHNFLPANTV